VARAVVVGGGIGGLAAAVRLAAVGHWVTLVEARPELGGRAYQLRDRGFTWDMGPTIVTAPHLLAGLWAAAGRRLEEDVDLIPIEPYYEIRFGDGERLRYGGPAVEDELARISPRDVAGYRRFMADTGAMYDRAFEALARRPFHRLGAFVGVVPELVRLGGLASVYGYVSRYFRDERLRIAFSFHPLFIGGNPFRASAFYAIVPYLERKGGVLFPRGGTHALVQAMARLLERLGSEVRTGEPVEEILVRGGRAAGVRTAAGAELSADLVVSNADPATTWRMLPGAPELRSYAYSMSCFVLYLGLDRAYPELGHHTILMPRDFQGVVEGIFRGQLREDDLALYLHAPTRTDPSLAPPGCESAYALMPVPNLDGEPSWPATGDRLRARALAMLGERMGLRDVETRVEVEHRFTPVDFHDRLRSERGAAFSIEPTLFQSAYFRPHNAPARLPGLYLVGAGTHPGAGLPGVLMSAEIAASMIGPAVDAPARSMAVAAG
jgi:phytoene desaturase